MFNLLQVYQKSKLRITRNVIQSEYECNVICIMNVGNIVFLRHLFQTEVYLEFVM